jgi:UDP-glucose:glycoprotein glucosyltransferase
MLSYAGGRVGVRLDDAGATPPEQSSAVSTDASDEEEEDDDTIHCFSLASGLLYERFVRIMMRSAAQRSSRPLKFWLLGNFLSAGFRESVESGALARAVGAKVAMVTYSWPFHLRHQREKQRLIWGYKILFLDVLFPLRVRRIMYIDADQMVNADLAELWTMDLRGAAVGMTPFCKRDANEHTTGFRFFEQGYWAGHLAGRPYHISALFVVDLAKLRYDGIGNTYRMLYDSLSKDPNSLANLDQDLPNYAQSLVPIYSLPEEWLWCETWCGNSSKPKAKTIDLCNNPLTKEPKLDQARRILGERWGDIDSSIERALRTTADATVDELPPASPSEKTEL